jgi:hypothetical protein
MENPNEYNDEEWGRWSVEVDTSIQAFWEAGATVEEIAEAVKNALENIGMNVEVDIMVDERIRKTPKRRLEPKPEKK